MNARTHQARTDVQVRLDSIRMSELDRRRAYTNLRNGELVAELVLRAAADLRAIAQYAEHAALRLASSIRAMLADFSRYMRGSTRHALPVRRRTTRDDG